MGKSQSFLVSAAAVPHWLRHSVWFVCGAAVAFFVPYVGVSLLDLQHDLYYLVYFAATVFT